MHSRFKKVLLGSAIAGSTAYLSSWIISEVLPHLNEDRNVHASSKPSAKRPLPPRSDQLKSLKSESFDVLIIGGGASGAGCALDAQTRGLKTALIEMDDFASGTSSRSTKLIHGGVRYLQKAIMNFDVEQYNMVKEALHERAFMLTSAPHLTQPLPIMVPVYQWWQVPYYWVGMKMYDLVAGFRTVKHSFYIGKTSALEYFPMLRKEKLCGAIVYYDGQQDDARMCLAIALTATRHGATVANHIKAIKLHKDGNGHCSGARLRDELTGEEWDCNAKCIINATGPQTDSIRKMDDPSIRSICAASAGTHIVLPGYYSPEKMGLLDPSTSDGRVIFFLPWQKHTIAGTTDLPCEVTHHPKPTEDEILFILQEIKNYLNKDVEVRRGDVLSAWTGIRPLVSDPDKPDTQSLARTHVVQVSKSQMITLAGGKWTTYRAMAADAIDAAIKTIPEFKEKAGPSISDKLLIEGAHGWTPTMYIRLVQDFGLECEVAQHLSYYYGDRAFAVAKLANLTGKRWPIIGNKIHPEFPYIDAEIRYGVREYAMTAIDMIARRLRLSFLNVQAAREALPLVIDTMAKELNWNEEEKKRQTDMANEFLMNEMGEHVNRTSKDKVPLDLTKEEMSLYIERFRIIDQENKGYISINDMRRSFKNFGVNISGPDLHEMLREIDTNMNGQVELDEYLQMMCAVKAGHISSTATTFVKMTEMEHEQAKLQNKIPVERSGGGL